MSGPPVLTTFTLLDKPAVPPVTKYNTIIKTFYDRLVSSGKPKLVALIAAMRKLLTILNVMIRNGQTWKNGTAST